MRKLLLLVLSFAIIAFAAGPVAAVYMYTSPFSADSVLTSPLPQGEMVLSGQLEMYSANQAEVANDPGYDSPKWGALGDDGINSFTYTVIPIRFTYGITDDIAARITIPYVSQSMMVKEGYSPWGAEEIGGGNIGDARIEGLYEVMKEGENMPSIGANLAIKMSTGTYDRDWIGLKNPMLGTGATDYSLSGVVKKQIGPVVGKAMLSYVITGDTVYNIGGWGVYEVTVMPVERIVYSIAAAYPVDSMLEVGGEIWGVVADKDAVKVKNPSGTITPLLPDSEINTMILAPYIVYNVMDNLALRGVIEIPLSQQPSYSMADAWLNNYTGTNVILGASWTIM